MDIETALAFTDSLVFEKVGLHLSDLQQAILRESWSLNRQSYDQIADTYGYSPSYLKHDIGPKLWKLLSDVLGEKVNKTNFRTAIERKWKEENRESLQVLPRSGSGMAEDEQQAEPIQAASKNATDLSHVSKVSANSSAPAHASIAPHASTSTTKIDWGEAIDVSFFYGRQLELAQLEQWILGESAVEQQSQRCRLVAVLSVGGMGKTLLSIKLAQRLVGQFEWMVWRSLQNAPPIQELLTDLLYVLSGQQDPNIPETVDGQISRLMHYLRSHRCLLVFDNVETILQGGRSAGNRRRGYRAGYEKYGALFQQVGEIGHQSCLLLTSREKPPEVALLEGEALPVRCLQLEGLSRNHVQQMLRLKTMLQGGDDDWDRLISGYSGNPLALKMISTTIQSLFNNRISEFLQQNTLALGNIRHLIQQQFERLSSDERTVMFWLAIYREPASFAELRADIFPTVSPQTLIEILESLEQRSLIEKNAALFSLQPVVMEYTIDRLVEQVCEEIRANLAPLPSTDSSPQPLLFKHHALLKAQAKDYIRESQSRLILHPILDRLRIDFSGRGLETHLMHLCTELQGKTAVEIGYAGGNLLNLLCQGKTRLSHQDFSRLTIWQAYLQNLELHQVDFAESDLSQSVFAETLGIVFAVAFSPDGTLLATGDAEGGLRVWQVADGTLLLNCEGHAGWVWSIAFSANGEWMASCSSDKTICLWQVKTGTCLRTLRGHTSSIWSVAFRPDNQILASGGDEPIVRLWDVHTGECIQCLSGHTGCILSVCFSADGQLLASGSDDGTIRLWDATTGECQSVLQGHTNRIWSVAFSGDSRLLVSGSADRTLKLWQVSTGDCLATWQEHGDRVRSVLFGPDDQTVISGSDDQTIRLWQVSTGQCLTVLRGHTNSIFSVTCNANHPLLASGSADQTVRFWNLKTGRCLKTLKGYTNSVFSVAVSPDGQTIASSSTDQTVKLWTVSEGTCSKVLQGHQGWVTSVAFHPQGQWLASSSADQTVRLWSVATGRCLHTLQGHANWVQSVAFSPEGEWLASAGDDRTIRLWSVQTGHYLKTLEGHTHWIWSIAFSPRGDLLASSSEDQTIRVWCLRTGACLQVLEGHRSRIQSIAFSPDGERLASGSNDETIRVWCIHTGTCLQTLAGHENNVWSVAFSPDGAMLASGSLDQTVRLWDVTRGYCLRTWSVLTHSVRSSIAFQPIPHPTLVTGSHNGTIQLWDTATGHCLQTLIPDRPYQGTNITGVTGITEAQKAALKALGAIEAPPLA